MKAVLLKIDLIQPVLATALDGDPNSAVSFRYIPGSVLRGAAISAYMRKNKLSSMDSGSSTLRERFFGGTFFLNAYLAHGESCRSLPPLLSWREKKHETDSRYDWAVEIPQRSGEQWKNIGSHNFWVVKNIDDEPALIHVSPSLTLMVHTMRDRIYGRARGGSEEGEHGAVYRYQALADGQTFLSAVLCGTDEIAREMAALLNGDFHLGGSRSAGYGHVRLTVIGEPIDHWREINQAVIPYALSRDHLPAIQAKNPLRITFLSDALFRNSYGQYSVDPQTIQEEVAKALNCTLTLKDAFISKGMVGGFNNKWGLPMPQTQTVRMGSVLVFNAPDCSTEALVKLEQEGIGDRREDGFGRVAINWSETGEWKVPDQDSKQDPNQDTTQKPESVTFVPGSADEKLANLLLTRMLRQKLDAALYQEAARLAVSITTPSLSQMNQLAQACQDALQKLSAAAERDQESLVPKLQKQLQEFLTKLGRRKATASQYADLIGGKKILEWIDERIHDNQNIFQTLLGKKIDLSLGNLNAPLNPVLAFEYNLRLISMALRMAAKRKQQSQSNQPKVKEV